MMCASLRSPRRFIVLVAVSTAAVDGDEIVAPGTYNEAIDFLGKAITVRSSDGAEVKRSTRSTTAI